MSKLFTSEQIAEWAGTFKRRCVVCNRRPAEPGEVACVECRRRHERFVRESGGHEF